MRRWSDQRAGNRVQGSGFRVQVSGHKERVGISSRLLSPTSRGRDVGHRCVRSRLSADDFQGGAEEIVEVCSQCLVLFYGGFEGFLRGWALIAEVYEG